MDTIQNSSNFMSLFRIFLFVFATHTPASNAGTSQKSYETPSEKHIDTPNQDVTSDQISDEELLLWRESPDALLSQREGEIIRHIQLEPSSAYGFYLYSKFLFAQYYQSPSEVHLLQKVGDLVHHLIELEPDSEYGYILLHDLFEASGRIKQAKKILSQHAKESDKITWRTHLTLGNSISLMGKPKAAIKHITDAADSGAPLELVYNSLLPTLQTSYSIDKVKHTLRSWGKNYPHPEPFLALASIYNSEGRYKKAFDTYENILKTQTDHYLARTQQSIIAYFHLNKTALAHKNFESVIENTRDPNIASLARLHLASLNVVNNKLDDAKKDLIEVAKAGYLDESRLEFITHQYKSRSKFEPLAELLKQLTFNMKPSAKLYSLLGEVLSEKLSHHSKGMEAYVNAITLEPEQSNHYNGLGLVFYRMHDFNRALQLFETAENVNPLDGTAVYNQACVLALMNKKSGAITALQRAIKLDPVFSGLATNDSDFKSLHKDTEFLKLTQETALSH